MRILFLEQRPRFIGGSERMSLALCRHAIARGHEAWLAYAAEGDMVSAYEAGGAAVRQLAATPIAVRHPMTAWRSFTGLRSLTRSAGIDFVFTSQVNYVSLLAAVGRSAPVGTGVHLGLTYDYPSPVFRTGMRFIDVGVTPSEHTAAGWRDRDWPPASLRVIPNGVDTRTFSPGDGRIAARARLGLDADGSPLIAYVGRLAEEKGIFTLLRAFAAFRRVGHQGRLLFVGTPMHNEQERLAELGNREGLVAASWSVRRATPTPEDIYRAADIVVVPSEWQEPFGLVPLESMACGTMVVVSDRGILPSFVEPAGARAVFQAGNVEALCHRLVYWLGDGARREAAASQLLQHTRDRFNFERCGDAYLHAFQSCVKH
jgi:glycosyltransferase involved in cell wall biosynthesis